MQLRKILYIILFLLLTVSICQATTYLCGTDDVDDSCTISGMNTLIGSASNGDIIRIAHGSHDWTPGSSTYVAVNKRITITGEGYCGTSINDDPGVDCGDVEQPSGYWPVTINLPSSNDYSAFRIAVTTAGAGIVRITGLDFTGDTYDWYQTLESGGFITVQTADISQYRIDNNRFRGNPSNSIYTFDVGVNSMTYGLCDHNYHAPVNEAGKGYMIVRWSVGEDGGDCLDSWVDPVDWGTRNFVFLEDNSMNRGDTPADARCFLDAWCGARFVSRHNYINNGYSEFHGFTYGSWTSPGYACEWYDNVATGTGDLYRFFWWRGGTGLFHDNTISGTYGNGVWQFGEGCHAGNWSSCNGTQDWDGNCQADSAYTNNTDVTEANGFTYNCGDTDATYMTAYPIFGNPGWGQIPSATPTGVQSQAWEPIRIWSNAIGGLSSGMPAELDSEAVSLNRDVFYSTDDSAKPSGYVEYPYPHPLQRMGKGVIVF